MCDCYCIFWHYRFAGEGRLETKAWIEKVVIVGIPNLFRRAIIAADSGKTLL